MSSTHFEKGTTNGRPRDKTRGHGIHWYNGISTPLPHNSPRTLHTFLYNWS